jgi:uncharacterized protein YbjQ (UPF0145 family)
MLLSTTFEIPGRKVDKSLGVVTGNTVRSKHLGKDIVAGLRNIVGGEVSEYTEMLAESRVEALKRMTDSARKMNADAVIGVRFTTSSITARAAELLAYGTAVKLK